MFPMTYASYGQTGKKLPTQAVRCLDGGQDCVGLLVHLGVEAVHHAVQAAVVLVQAAVVLKFGEELPLLLQLALLSHDHMHAVGNGDPALGAWGA